MKRILPFALAAILLFPVHSCTNRSERWDSMLASLPEPVAEEIAASRPSDITPQEEEYLTFLYESMPLPDMAYPFSYWLANVRKTLQVRKNASWDVPEREFRHFVLPVRANNEALDDFRLLYADELCARVKGMDAREAALEINHWCHEMATYTPTDARTLPPTGTISAGLGRCGEESVLAVAALRAAGIPARQVYTPRWAHTDDNHAWVEVYVDGGWHFMGACEPEPVLDLAWFNAPVSRAMLLHTRAFGDYDGPEDVISRTRAYTEINVIKSYIPTRRTEVEVVDLQGNAVEDATVEFKIYNYAEFYTVASVVTGPDGRAGLDTGCGDILVWAFKDGKTGLAKASSGMTRVVLDHTVGEAFSADFEMVPPVENPIPSTATPGQARENALRLAYEDSVRLARPKGNDAVISAFLEAHPGENAPALLASLSKKDLGDVRADVLEEAVEHCDGAFRPFRDCPRVSYEPIVPYFRIIGEGLDAGSPQEIFEWTRDSIRVDDGLNPQGLYVPPLSVWRTRTADSRSRNIFFVASCRSRGFEARIDNITGKTQYLEGGEWKDVKWEAQIQKAAVYGSVRAEYDPVSWLANPLYYRHFTISRIEGGRAMLLNFDENASLGWKEILARPYPLEAGSYLLTSGVRKADGSVTAHMEFFNVEEGRETVVPLVLKQNEGDVVVRGNIDAEKTYRPLGQPERTLLSTTGRGYFAMAVFGDFSEPSIHALRQLAATSQELSDWGRTLVVIGPDEDGCGRMGTYLGGMDNVSYGTDPDGKILAMVREGCFPDTVSRLPLIIVADSFGRVVYASQGYNTSLSEQLKSVIYSLK